MATPQPSALIKLPIEIHRAIAEHLEFPYDMNLKMANRLLYKRIDPLTFEAAIQAETTPFARSHHLFACKDCCRLRPKHKFRDNRDDYLRDIENDNRYGDSHEWNDTRPFCIECGFKNQLWCFKMGNTFDIDVICSEAQVFCDSCNEFPRPSARKAEGFCKPCWVWVLTCPTKLADVEARRCPLRRTKWAKIQMGGGEIYHSIRCENGDCRKPFMACHHVAGNKALLKGSANTLQYYGYSWNYGKEALEQRTGREFVVAKDDLSAK